MKWPIRETLLHRTEVGLVGLAPRFGNFSPDLIAWVHTLIHRKKPVIYLSTHATGKLSKLKWHSTALIRNMKWFVTYTSRVETHMRRHVKSTIKPMEKSNYVKLSRFWRELVISMNFVRLVSVTSTPCATRPVRLSTEPVQSTTEFVPGTTELSSNSKSRSRLKYREKEVNVCN